MMETEITRRFGQVASIAKELHEVTAALEIVIKSELDDEARGDALNCVLRAQISTVEKLFSIFNHN